LESEEGDDVLRGGVACNDLFRRAARQPGHVEKVRPVIGDGDLDPPPL
jgi:hypothetical protein